MAKKSKKFIQKAVKRPGAFGAWCKKNGFASVTNACIEKAISVGKRTRNMRLIRQANFAKIANRKGGF